MANIQRTRNKDTVTQTAIDQKQSLEVVQTMLHGSLSQLTYMRNFFPEKAFDEQTYTTSDGVLSYEDYAAGKLPKRQNDGSKPRTTIKVLRRGRSKRTDLFHDWLEYGAFAALKAGNLQSVHLYVHGDPNSREKIIESYTFTVKYLPHPEGDDQVVAGLEMDSSAIPIVTVGATNAELQFIFRRIHELCKSMPDLPERRFMSMTLFYLPETEPHRRLAGFVPSTIETHYLAEAEGWERREEQIKELRSGFHSSSLKISYLQDASFHSRSDTSDPSPATIPERLRYDLAVSLQHSIGVPEPGGSIIGEVDGLEAEDDPLSTTTPSTIIESEYAPESPEPAKSYKGMDHVMFTPLLTSETPIYDFPASELAPQNAHLGQLSQEKISSTLRYQTRSSQPSEPFNTQSSNVPDMQHAFNEMMQIEQITQGDTQTQRFPPPSRTKSVEAPDCNNDFQARRPELDPLIKGSKPALSQSAAKQLESVRPDLRETALRLANAEGSKRKSDLVLCHCGYAEDEGAMVNCAYCDTWQHLHCYGYTGAQDDRLPDEHVCYQCLLGEREDETLEKLRGLTLRRRAMFHAQQEGIKTSPDFAKAMGLQIAIANSVCDYLRKERYIVAAGGSRRGANAAKGKPHFVAVKDGPDYEKMLKDLFDPLMHISHHYELPAKLPTQMDSLARQLLASQAGQMPPPITPASYFKKSAAKTPASDLDLSNSMTPFETPSRPRRTQMQTSKRRRGDVDDADTPEKRRQTSNFAKRLTSVQSEVMIDARGCSSSPNGPIGGQ